MTHWLRFLCIVALAPMIRAQTDSAPATRPADGLYAIVVSRSTAARESWKPVVEVLEKEHAGVRVLFDRSIEETAAELARLAPRRTAFVLRPSEISRDVIARIHRLTRHLDDDPYTDTMWGIITGRGGDEALRVAKPAPALIVKKALTTTGVNDALYESVFTLSDGAPDTWHEKTCDGKTRTEKDEPTSRPTPLWKLFGERWKSMAPDMIVSSSHGFQFGIEMPFSRGMFGGFQGRLSVFDLSAPQAAEAVDAQTNTKIFLPVGNCLVGDLDQRIAPDSLVLSLQAKGGVRQAIGYTVETWYGRGGWGLWNWFQGNPGVYTLAESFYFNEQTLIRDLQAKNPRALSFDYDWKPSPADKDPQQKMRAFFEAAAAAGFDPNDRDLMGLLWDRDTVAFFGDPAWSATLDRTKAPTPWRLDIENGTEKTTLTVTAIDRTAMKDARPIGTILPRDHRPRHAESAMGAACVGDDFVIFDARVAPPDERGRLTIVADGAPAAH